MNFPEIEWGGNQGLKHVFYHSFTATALPHIEPLFQSKSPSDLERDLIYLKSRFRIVSHDEVAVHRENGYQLPPNAVTVSFDDGFIECFTVARPLLLAYGVPATFFVCKSFIDNHALMFRNKVALCLSHLAEANPAELSQLTTKLQRELGIQAGHPGAVQQWLLGLGFAESKIIESACECLGVNVRAFLQERRPYMSRIQIAQLHSEGFTIGAHTNDHPRLGALKSWNDVRRQVEDSCNTVREITGRTRVPFAFPFNGLDLARTSLAALRNELGSVDLMYDTTDFRNDCPFIVNRVCCDTPKGSTEDCSNVPNLLRRADLLRPLRELKHRLRRGRKQARELIGGNRWGLQQT